MVENVILSGRYRLQERLATGGMGTVYSGVDERLGRRVAVKLLKEDLAGDPRFVERFRREARAVAALSHPNIASVFDYGEEGSHFIVMELVDGRDLARVLSEDGRLDPERTIAIGTQVLDALQHAHDAGVVHRDVKPGNVIIGHSNRVKVTDFGIARALGDSTLTATGSVLGSAHYVAPEQAEGKSTSPQTDIYSTGIVLYEMLTGELPFTGESPLQVALRQVSDPMAAPSAINKDVPAGLDAVVATATAKDPGDRFASAAAMSSALHSSLGAAFPAAADAPTAALAGADSGGTTLPFEDTGTATSWGPGAGIFAARRIGAGLLALLVLVVVVAGAVLAYRLVQGNDSTSPKKANGGGPGAVTSSTSESPTESSPPESSPPESSPPESSPPESSPADVTVPSVTGRSYDDAKSALEDEGFHVARVDDDTSSEPKDTVIGQNPEASAPAPEGSTVTLTVSTGPPPSPAGSPPKDKPPGKAKGHNGHDKHGKH